MDEEMSLSDGVDPCFLSLLADPRNHLRPPRRGSSMAPYREALNRAMISSEILSIDAIEEHEAPSPAGPVPLRLYRPEASVILAPAILFLHGGGFVIGSLDSHDELCRALALARVLWSWRSITDWRPRRFFQVPWQIVRLPSNGLRTAPAHSRSTGVASQSAATAREGTWPSAQRCGHANVA